MHGLFPPQMLGHKLIACIFFAVFAVVLTSVHVAAMASDESSVGAADQDLTETSDLDHINNHNDGQNHTLLREEHDSQPFLLMDSTLQTSGSNTRTLKTPMSQGKIADTPIKR